MTAPSTPTAATGNTGVLGVILTIIGLLAAAFPNIPVLHMLVTLIPQLNTAVPVALSILGTVMTMFSHPPAWAMKLLGSVKS